MRFWDLRIYFEILRSRNQASETTQLVRQERFFVHHSLPTLIKQTCENCIFKRWSHFWEIIGNLEEKSIIGNIYFLMLKCLYPSFFCKPHSFKENCFSKCYQHIASYQVWYFWLLTFLVITKVILSLWIGNWFDLQHQEVFLYSCKIHKMLKRIFNGWNYFTRNVF